MRLFEEAGTCNAVRLTAEKLFLDAIGTHHRCRDADERRLRTRAPLVDHARGDFLADTRGPGDQDAAPGRRHSLQRRTDVVDGDGRPVKLIVMTDLLAQGLILA